MALNEYQKRWALQQSGFDPDLYDIDAFDNIIPRGSSVQPTATTTPLNPTSPEIVQPEQSDDTPLQTFAKSAATSVIPTLGAGGGAALGVSLGAPLGPIGMIGGGIIGGLGGGTLLSKLQSMVLPEQLERDIALSQATNPLSALGGSLATLPLGGFNPSPSMLGTAAGAIPKLATRLTRAPLPTTAAEQAALLNVGLGAGINAAIPAGQSLAQGELPNAKDVLLNAAIGGLFNKPNVIGRQLFRFPSGEAPRELPGEAEFARASAEQPEVPTISARGITPAEIVAAGGLPHGTRESLRSGALATAAERSDVMAKYKGQIDPMLEAQLAMEAEGGISPSVETIRKQELAQQQRIADLQNQLVTMRQEANQQRMFKQYEQLQANEARIAELEAQLNQARMTIPFEPTLTTGVTGAEPIPAKTPGLAEAAVRPLEPRIEAIKLSREEASQTGKEAVENLMAKHNLTRLEAINLLQKRREEYGIDLTREQAEPAIAAPKTKFSEEVQAGLKERGLAGNLTEAFTQLFQKFGLLKRNALVQPDGTIKNALTDKPIAGNVRFDDVLKKWLVKFNPDKASVDTLPHELGHAYIAELRNSKRQSDRDLILKLEKAVEPELAEINAKRAEQKLQPWDAEEFIATEQGVEFLRRQLNLSGESGIKTWWRDMAAHFKTHYSKASPEEMRRLLQYRFQHDPAIGANKLVGPVGVVREKTQEEPVTKPEEGKAVFIGEQPGFGHLPAMKLYNLTADIVDPETGAVKHRTGSTVSQRTLDKYGVKYSEEAVIERGATAEDTALEHAGFVRQKGKLGRDGFYTLDDPRMQGVSILDWPKAYTLLRLAVKPELQGKGVGGEILEKLKSASNESGKPIELIAEADSKQHQAALEKFYSAHGFEKVDENNFRYEPSVRYSEESAIPLDRGRQPLPYGHWIKPDGTMLKTTSHEKTAIEELKNLVKRGSLSQDEYDKLNIPFNSTTEVENLLHKFGYVRGVQDGNDYIVNGRDLKQPLTNQQRRALKDYGIENNVSTLYKRGDISSKSPFDFIHNVEKYSEEPAIKRQKGEGKTPYPFTMKELKKGRKALAINSVTLDEFGQILNDYKTEISELIKQKVPEFQNPKLKLELPELYPYIMTEEGNNILREWIGDLDANQYIDALTPLYKARSGMINLENLGDKSQVLNQDEPAITERSSFVSPLTSRYDKVTEKLPNNPTAKMVSDNFHRFSGESDLQSARFGNRLISPTKDYTPEEIKRVYRHNHQMSIDGDSPINLTGREQKLADAWIQEFRDQRDYTNNLGLKVRQGETYRAGGMNPNGYMFSEIDPKVPYTWAEKPKSAEAKQYDRLYIDHMVKHGMLEPDAIKQLDLYKKALGSDDPQSIEFGPLRKAAGKGLPWELVDQNFASAAARYGRRAGSDVAYFKYIQNDPKMLRALNLRDQYGNNVDPETVKGIDDISENAAVKEAKRSVFGVDSPRNITAMAFARGATNTLLGHGSAARNILTMPAFILQYTQLKQLPLVMKAITRLNETKKRAFENNAVRASFADYDAAGYYEGSPNPVIRLLNRYSEFMRKYQGRNLSDKFEGEFYYSLGELLAVDNIARAKTGDKEALRFVKRFGDIVEGDPLTKQITQDDISRIAKRFVDATRGTYSAEGLPSWAIEGEFAPFTSLSRWSIEKSNTIWKDVILPMKQGIYGPFLRYVLGSAGVGFLVDELNEMLTGKRGAEPTVSEVIASGDEGDLVAKAIALGQLASFAGIVSDGAQLASSAVRGKGLKYNQPLSFPLYSWMTDTLAGNVSGTINALKEGEDPFETLAQFVTSMATQSVQSARYLDGNFIHPEEAKRKERFRDYNIWQELTDTKEASPMRTDTASAYKDIGAKKFKREEDLGKAAERLPELIEQAFNKSKGNPEQLKKELLSLKLNSYQTMPNPENFPMNFFNYLEHLRKTQGEEAANETLVDYIRKNEINKAKASLVPSF